VVGEPKILRGKDTVPIWIGPERRVVTLSVRLNLIKVYGQVHPVRVHPDVAYSQVHIARQLPFNGQVPLSGLRIPVIGRGILIEVRSSDELLNCGRVKGGGKLVAGRAGYRISIRIRAYN